MTADWWTRLEDSGYFWNFQMQRAFPNDAGKQAMILTG